MNDRYLYRAKRTDNGEWVEGFYVNAIEEHGNGERTAEIVALDAMRTFDGISPTLMVDPSTICQCTGLNDKNGKLIWENDVVKHDFGKDQIGVQLAIVKYDSKYACYQIKPIYDWMYCDKSDCEVIGNIFDNPELLEVGE